MRLLHFDGGNLVLTNFSGRGVPPYAILSHRWGDDEVLFEDVKNNSYGEKNGYLKIEFCAKQAAKDELGHFWIDTCCIDKWNNRERSNAINAMFRWYQNAKRCYVFLPDVSASASANGHPLSLYHDSFQPSEWFSRGWTLQELIAPQSVEFFSKEGHRIGDKESLEASLCEITGIPAEALRGRPLTDFTTDERMRWAERRITTEPEDSAYCLLGILDVTMSTPYGEGKEAAFERLRNELRSTDNIPLIIPYSRNRWFVGRESQLAELESKLFQDQQTTTVAISGAGGMGKSQLALALVYRITTNDHSCSVFWIDASSGDSLHQGYTDIAQKIGILTADSENVDVQRLVRSYLGEASSGKWLLVLDNVEDPADEPIGATTTTAIDLLEYLPRSGRGSVVFTTTSTDIAHMLAEQNTVTLHELMPDAAQRMLLDYLFHSNESKASLKAGDLEQMKLLLKELLHIPLAITLAMTYIRLTNVTLEDYRSHLMKLQGDGTTGPISATLLITLNRIRSHHPLTAEYLFLMACVERRDILQDILWAASKSEKEEAIKVLDSYALVTRRPAESALDVHRLVHLATRHWLEEQQLLRQWTKRAIEHLLRVFPDDQYGNRSKWRRLVPHAKYVLSSKLIEKDDRERMELANKYGRALSSDGRWKEAEGLFVQVMETMKRVLGEEHPDTLTSIDNLALTYINQGRWKEAEELQGLVMERRKRVLGEEHPDTLTSMNNLASTYSNQGRWKEAEELEMQVMETMKRVLGEEHPDTLTSVDNLASTYMNQGRWKEAEGLFVQVIETMKRVLGEEHPDTLTSIDNLASTYMNQGRWKEAEELQGLVMERRKRMLGEEHPDTLTSMNNLASTYSNQGQWKEAEELEMQVMETMKRVLGEEHPDTLTSVDNLASTYMNQGRWEEAEELNMQVMETRTRVLGGEHLSTLVSISNLASTYSNQGRWKEAEELEVQVMETMKRVLGEEHPDTLTSINNRASTYINQGRWKEAEELQELVMERRKRVLGEEHPDTLTSINNLASTYSNQGRWKEAEELEVQVMETMKRVLGEEHPDT